MPGMSQLGFGGGFLQGLTGVLNQKKQRERQLEDQQRQIQIWGAQKAIDEGRLQPEDLPTIIGNIFPEIGKSKPKGPGQPSAMQAVTNILGQHLAQPLPGVGAIQAAQEQGQAGVSGLPGGTSVEGGTPPLPSTPISAPAPTPPQPTMFGAPLLSQEQAGQRRVGLAISAEEQDLTARVGLARRLYPSLKAVDPSATFQDALMAAKVPVQRLGTAEFTPIAGMVDDKPVQAVIDHRRGVIVDPITHQPIPGFQPKVGAAGTAEAKLGTFGDYLKRYASDNGLELSKLTTEDVQKARQEYAKSGSVAGLSDEEKVKRGDEIADAIMSGGQPPDLSRLYGLSGYVRDSLAKKGYNLTQGTMDWQATTRYLASLNSTQQLRFRQATQFVNESIPLVEQLSDELSKQLPRGQFPVLNRATLLAARQGVLGEDAKIAAQNLDNQINELHTELGVMFRGGGASTNEALKRADQLLQSNWDEKQFKSALDLLKKNAQIRMNSMQVGPSGVSNAAPIVPSAGAAPATTTPKATKDKNGNWVISVP